MMTSLTHCIITIIQQRAAWTSPLLMLLHSSTGGSSITQHCYILLLPL
jgi:hypothetical protein